MAEKIPIKNKDRFLRSFLAQVSESTVLCRFGIGCKGEFIGRRTDGGFILYRKRQGIFNLFALTLRGSFSREGGKHFLTLRFGRLIPVAILWGIWCALMLFAGILLLGSSPIFALWFLVPGVVCALPLFLFSKKEKTRLEEFVKEIENNFSLQEHNEKQIKREYGKDLT